MEHIPKLFDNPTTNAVVLTIVPAALYTAAAYGHLLSDSTLGISIIIAIIFATLEYIVRIPIIKYSNEVAKMSPITMQIVWILLTVILAVLITPLIPQK